MKLEIARTYRKKPVVIEAIQWTDTDACRERMAAWFDTHHEMFITRGPQVVIETLEGSMLASVGDWIIRGVNGEFYPCKPDVFEKTYDAGNFCAQCRGTLWQTELFRSPTSAELEQYPFLNELSSVAMGRCDGCQREGLMIDWSKVDATPGVATR